MWNVKDDVTGWNIEKNPPKTDCIYRKKDCKCSMSALLHCDYRKDGKCTQCKND